MPHCIRQFVHSAAFFGSPPPIIIRRADGNGRSVGRSSANPLGSCGKTPDSCTEGKGTSSTRAVTAAPSAAASSRWGECCPVKRLFPPTPRPPMF